MCINIGKLLMDAEGDQFFFFFLHSLIQFDTCANYCTVLSVHNVHSCWTRRRKKDATFIMYADFCTCFMTLALITS